MLAAVLGAIGYFMFGKKSGDPAGFATRAAQATPDQAVKSTLTLPPGADGAARTMSGGNVGADIVHFTDANMAAAWAGAVGGTAHGKLVLIFPPGITAARKDVVFNIYTKAWDQGGLTLAGYYW